MDDEALLAGSIERLMATGRIEYRGEFGAEVATFIPYIAWLKREGLLEGRRVVSYRGMRPYYFFLSDDEFAARSEPRAWLPPGERGWPSPVTATAVKSRWHVMPDYRAQYRGVLPPTPLPILFVQNKFTVEWRVGPLNFMPLIAIEQLLRCAQGRFRVIYSRPGIAAATADYTPDENTHCAYPDRAMVERFEGVEILEDMAARAGGDYNALKLALLAQAHLFVAVQGGGAHLLAAFGRSLMLLLHCFGEEYPHAYRAGPYKYLADPPPTLLVARDYPAFDRGIALFDSISVAADRIVIRSEAQADFDGLRM